MKYKETKSSPTAKTTIIATKTTLSTKLPLRPQIILIGWKTASKQIKMISSLSCTVVYGSENTIQKQFKSEWRETNLTLEQEQGELHNHQNEVVQ